MSCFKLKQKLSFSPNRVYENVYQVRMKIGKKTADLRDVEVRETLIHKKRTRSSNAHHSQKASTKMFRNAHKMVVPLICSQQKYSIKTKQSSQMTREKVSGLTSLKMSERLKDKKSSSMEKISSMFENNDEKKKNIQRTISIKIDGRDSQVENQAELMTALSRLIMKGPDQDDFFLEFVQESSIHGNEHNFLDLDSEFLDENNH